MSKKVLKGILILFGIVSVFQLLLGNIGYFFGNLIPASIIFFYLRQVD